MKESSEDIMIKNIKEVLEQYEPDYSPQFWENLRKQRPFPEFRIKNLLLKYKFYLSCLVITGLLVIVYMDTKYCLLINTRLLILFFLNHHITSRQRSPKK
jgi:hypothetical protein